MRFLLIPCLLLVAGCTSCNKQEEKKLLKFEEEMFEFVDDDELTQEEVDTANKKYPRIVVVNDKQENPERASQI